MKNLCAKLLVLLILGVSGLASASDVDQSWKKASVYTPGAFLSKSTDGLALDKKYPVVIYMHGCTGITNHNDLAWAKYIAEMNFVVVVPDSMARKSRLSNCDPRQKGNTATFPQAHDYRQEEIKFALSQLKSAEWADQKNIFLMGHSEGGLASARSTYSDFKGIIISGWTCTIMRIPRLHGIYSPKNIPILAIAYLDDSWFKGKPNEGRCIDQADGRRVIQVDLVGSDHDTFSNSNAKNAVTTFLKDNLNRSD
jgi:dienelactone hydrolase